jgi:hypothetical protein
MSYLIIDHYMHDTHIKDAITREDLIDYKKGLCKMIVNMEAQTYYDATNNDWLKIERK